MTGVDPSHRRRLRALWRSHFETCARIAARHHGAVEAYIASAGRTLNPRDPVFPAFPEECRGLQCGARTRAGTPCKSTAIMTNGRCKLHGGMSTGPRTPSGLERSRANLASRWQRDR